MENITKALLIAAGVLLVIMVLTVLVMSYNQISTYYQQQHELVIAEQLEEFNKKFENYHRENIRGSDMISLMNRVIDYNESQVYAEGTNHKRIAVTIELSNSDDILNQFKYEINGSRYGSRNEFIKSRITNTSGNDRINDEMLTEITGTESKLINESGIDNLTSEKLQKLSSNISTVILDENSTDQYAIIQRLQRATLFESILELKVGSPSESGTFDIRIDDEAKTIQGATKVNKIKEITNQYYQYTQFKRAYFDCTEILYDKDTGRVCEMNFELKIENGLVVFN